MSFSVHELPRAKADKRSILTWLTSRSPQGASAWLRAYDDALTRMGQDPERFTAALESESCPRLPIKQAFFKTRRGRIYRIIFHIDGQDVYVMRVRGPGQAPVDPTEIQ